MPVPDGSFTATFLAEMAKLSGAKPAYYLLVQFATGDVFLGDRADTVTGWAGSNRTIQPWVHSWGKLDDVMSLDMSQAPVLAGDFRVTVAVPGGPASPSTFWRLLTDSSNKPEQTIVSLYLWFRTFNAATDPPVKIWEGTIGEWTWVGETRLEIQFLDMIERLDRPVSRPVTLTTFPNADPDDIGRIEPIVYGSVDGAPCLAVDAGPNDTLSFNMDASQTVLYYSNLNTPFAASGTVKIGNEDVSYIGKTMETLNGVTHGKLTGLTRGANGTTAAAHFRGDSILQAQSTYKFLVAGHPCKAVRKVGVVTELGDVVTIPGTDYTVNLNDTTTGLDGIARTVISFTATPKLERQFAVTVNDNLTVGDNIGGTVTGDRGVAQNGGTGSFNLDNNGLKLQIAFSDPGFTPSRYDYTINLAVQGSVNSGAQIFIGHGSAQVSVAYYNNGVWSTDGAAFLTTVSNTLQFYTSGFTLFNGNCVVTRTQRVCIGAPNFSKTGGAFRGGSVTGNSAADIVFGGRIVADVDGYQDDATGTWTGTANALITRARDVLRHFLVTSLNGLVFSNVVFAHNLADRMGETYTLQGRVDEPAKARSVASRMAFECGCWLKFQAGKAVLIFRERLFAPSVDLDTHRLAFLGDGRQTAEVSRTGLDWVINQIDVRYKRRWRERRAVESYDALERQSDADSQSRYGVKERPDLFLCDWVTTQAHAQALAALYLGLHRARRPLVKVRTRLQYAHLGFGDRVRLQDRMAPRLIGELVSADHTPPSARDGQLPALDFLLLAYEEADTMLKILDKTANYTLVKPADLNAVVRNKGAAGLVTITLPPAVAGDRFIFYVHDAQELRVDPAGTEIHVLTFTSGNATDKTAPTAQAAGKYLSSATPRSLLVCWCLKDGEWQAVLANGTWTIEI